MFPSNKTKIVCTIGPASRSPEMLVQLIDAGMNVARLNFSHGAFEGHARDIDAIRRAAQTVGRPVAVMADMPGPKIRIGELSQEPIQLKRGQALTLTTRTIDGTAERISVNFAKLPSVVNREDRIYINDGFIQLRVLSVDPPEVRCEVVVGGTIRSRKGLNIPDVDLGISAFTDYDRQCLEFALQHGVDAISQSFVENGKDIAAVRARPAATRSSSPRSNARGPSRTCRKYWCKPTGSWWPGATWGSRFPLPRYRPCRRISWIWPTGQPSPSSPPPRCSNP